MERIRELIGRLLNAVWRSRAEAQLAREVRSHLDLLEERFLREGMAPEEARRAARRAFGGVEQAKEVQRDARSFLWLDDARRDVGYALRTLRRTPGFTVVAVITLSLGIGAATVIYSVLHNVVVEPFPYVHGDRMVNVVIRDRDDNVFRGPLPPAEFLDFLEQSTVLEDVAGTAGRGMHMVSDTGAERVSVIRMTPNGFAYLGVPPMMGRHFGPADATPDAPPVAVLSYRAWHRSFGGDPSILGRRITLDGEPKTIVGVMPPRFEWHVGDLWVPATILRGGGDQSPRYFQARLRKGVTVEEAEAQMAVIVRRRAALFPDQYPEGTRVDVLTIIDWVVRQYRQTLYTLFAAVSLLLLIACCNVANMLLARGMARARELTVRSALGASRARIVRQLFVESVVLAALGTVVGIALAYGGVRALATLLPRAGVAWEVQLRLNESALQFALATAALATLIFGLFPAFNSAGRDLVTAINAGGRAGTGGRRERRLRTALVVAEVALSVVLLLGAGVLMKTFASLVGVDLGFNVRNLLTTAMSFPPAQPASAAAAHQFYFSLVDRIAAVPGVESAAIANGVPPMSGSGTLVEVLGAPASEARESALHWCSETYLDTLGVPLTAGRGFTRADVAASRQIAIVNRTLAERFFGKEVPIGRSIRMPMLARPQVMPAPLTDPTFEIIGVVADVVNRRLTDPVAPHVYVPFTIGGVRNMRLVVRTSEPPPVVQRWVRAEIDRLDRGVASTPATSVEEELRRSASYAWPRFNVVVIGLFAVTGLVLVALGIYGVMAYTVAQQTRQIAIRLALGSNRSQVLTMVLRGGLVMLAGGLVVGVGAGLVTNRLLATVLWRVTPHDPATIAGTIVLVVVVGLAACYVPAWRAMRVDPAVALRQE